MSESEAPRPEVSESWTPPRPEWSRVALRQDLLDLAEDMRAWVGHPVPSVVWADQTELVAALVASGRWDIDSGVAWLEAGRAALVCEL
ncbi:MAG: hypothetical protein B5766_12890 [Candidatus Lumbricidophila eiseniae]|uniref:Uncharacterized protein n=1 Tax=Candidatus Lumbricidiphila eiseniae TaxID=1969409 RepID=A0A2A6FP02_9MICO|nr:MAG: hypothetical protein B5766_12890 [Candidatus Lumbricidophila eiseniae]